MCLTWDVEVSIIALSLQEPRIWGLESISWKLSDRNLSCIKSEFLKIFVENQADLLGKHCTATGYGSSGDTSIPYWSAGLSCGCSVSASVWF